MELFPDGHHVRLRSYGRKRMYLHADKDGVGVYLSSLRASLNAAWQVHHVVRDGVTFLLLHGAAYGRYLAATNDPPPRGHIGQRVVQAVYDEQNRDAVSWNPIRVVVGDNEVLLQHTHVGSANRLLRANGKFCWWRTGVTVDDYFNQDAMMHWVVEAIPPRPSTPELPYPNPADRPGGFWNKLVCLTSPALERRKIRFVQAADDGSFDPNGWSEIEFHGRSVFDLRLAVARVLSQGITLGIKLCVRAGTLGRLTPLVVDLPRSEDEMHIVVLTDGTPGAELRDPDVDA